MKARKKKQIIDDALSSNGSESCDQQMYDSVYQFIKFRENVGEDVAEETTLMVGEVGLDARHAEM